MELVGLVFDQKEAYIHNKNLFLHSTNKLNFKRVVSKNVFVNGSIMKHGNWNNLLIMRTTPSFSLSL